MNTTSTRRLSRLSAAAAVGAVVTSGLLLAGSPAAQAVNVHFVRGDQVDTSETRAKGHNDFTANGVHITTDASACDDPNPAGGTYCANKAAGYFDVNLPLADVGEPSMLWTPISGATAPGLQLRVDFDDDGNIDGTLVGETVYNGNWWLSNAEQFVKDAAPTVGGGGSAYNGPLDTWRAAFPHAQVFTSGWSLGSGIQGEGTLGRITLGDDRYYFQPSATPSTTTVYRAQVDTQYTRTKGHNEFPASGGIHVTTDAPADSQSKAAGYFGTNIPLSASGAVSGLDFALASGFAPGLQLVTDFDNDGTADGTLVSEAGWPGIYWLAANKLDGNPVALWLKDLAPRKPGAAEPTIPGYSAGGGTPAEWRVDFPDARILQTGYSLGSGAVGDGLLNSISVGLHRFTFAANRAPVAPNQAATTTAGGTVQVTLAATDPDGDTLTYSSTDATVAGNKLSYTAPKDFAGSKVLAYRATDPSGAFATGTVTVTVTKATSSTSLTVVPAKITTRSKHVRAKVTVTSAGAVAGGTVDLYDGTTKLGTGVLDADGEVEIAVTTKLAKGNHTFRAVYAGSTATSGSDASVVVKVKKAKKK
jgi:Big-like domain-containing protein